ncbi:hypothetical protein BSZ22_15015 [Bradyrhizobium canariense]|uniref:Uncharacterized protein n=1 Tax=Bradyrhizobium canariense TaxID=255045 RepID=A0A1X3H5N9_9BRAD|nr:hypothetical protein BSZ22_15015 [Bradyrhizobium canariense]OSI74144.1 hypothetical protein BSZ23_32945 [Bradyrhizobium canariense]OSI84505.1 hypothetical protein BSZ25_35145 [Bradyrhizobium canariense]OSI89357.1 hypothetical protein BSZ24_22145 [Bradyrhizobium canariense]OSJ01921.1 hypothetical protein BSZ16_18050 [Bradyrhizobium canariense]
MTRRRDVGPMAVQPERTWAGRPVSEHVLEKKPQPQSGQLSATRAVLLRRHALRTQRALLADNSDGRTSSSK